MEENLGIVPIDKINKEKIEENDGDDNLMDLEWTEKDFLNKIVDMVEDRYNNKDIKKKNIYTLLGHNILIAVNPYGDMEEIKKIFYNKDIEDFFHNNLKNLTGINPPKAHIYYLIEVAYSKMLSSGGRRQNFIITGESGSGKTESSKLILYYLTRSNNDEISKLIMDSNPILEAFGNAKTVRNDNSSRFGKLIEIKFSKDGKILGATIKSYLLEKSRVVQLQEGEQNFKIFYQLILGKDEEEEKKYKIKPLEYYKYLKNEKNIENEENIKYKNDFLNTKKCLKNFNFSPDEIDNLFKILSGILYLGNIEFIKKDNQKYLDIDDKSKEDLQNASIFFGLEVDVLKRILTRKKNPNYEGPDPYEPYDIEKAENIRDSIAKELYSELFKFIIDKKINPKIKNGDDNKDGDNNKKDDNNNYIISILDIFGFENFKENSFEQLCINYSNEKLQQYFIKEIFKAEQKLYDDEGINYDKIDYKDNEKIIKLIGRRKGGPSIFGLLEEVYRLKDEKVKDKDKKFREKVYDEFFKKNLKKIRYKDTEENDLLEYRYKEEYSLNIHHYAGIVRYNVKGMVKKNILESNNDLIKEFEKKDIKNRLIFEIFKDKNEDKNEDKNKDKKGKINGFITEKFGMELEELFKKYRDSDNKYIKCIKPNNVKKENNFERKIVLAQMGNEGFVAVVQVKKLGYPVHKEKDEFIKKYNLLFPKINNKESFDKKIKEEIAIIGDNKFNDFFQNGKKKFFFMKEVLENFLDVKLFEKKQIIEKSKKLLKVLFKKYWEKYWMSIIKLFLTAFKTINIIKKIKLTILRKNFNNCREKIKKEKELEEIKRKIEEEAKKEKESEEIKKRKIEEQRKKEKELEEINRKIEEEAKKEKESEEIKNKEIELNEENKNANNRNKKELPENKENINQNVNINIVASYDKSNNIIELDKLRKFEEEQNKLKKKIEELEKNYMDLFKKYSNMEKHEKWNQSENFIIAEINIKENDINENIKIISSFEECRRNIKIKPKKNNIINYDNENDELKEKCLIKIDNREIPFDYYYKFKKIGKHTIQYIFNAKIITSKYMFCGCKNLTNIDLSNFDTEDITDMSYMFYGCENLTNLDLSNLNTKKVINMCRMFSKCNSLKSIDISKFETKNVTDMSYMFCGCKNLTNIDLSNFDTGDITDMSYMFYGCENLTNIDLSNLNTKKVINMCKMFYKCNSLKSIDISKFETKNVTDMSYMFYGCKNLTNIDLSNFDTQNVNNICFMFGGCGALQSLDLSNVNTKNVTNMTGMFSQCKSLKNINLLNFNTQKVNNMCDMFKFCSSLQNINLSNFNTENVTNMSFMFCSCESLQKIDISSFNVQNVNDMRSMFSGCKCLSDLDKQKIINMDKKFYECFSKDNKKQLYSSIAINQKQTDINNIFDGLKLNEIQDEELEHMNLQNPRLSYNKANMDLMIN